MKARYDYVFETFVNFVRSNGINVYDPSLDIEQVITDILQIEIMCYDVTKLDFYEYSKDGFTYGDDNKNIIFINKDQYITRKRFTLAHELGHIALNHKLELDNIPDNVRETEANTFASLLLCPPFIVLKTLESYRYYTNITDEIIERLSSDFIVSEEAMRIVLHNLTWYLDKTKMDDDEEFYLPSLAIIHPKKYMSEFSRTYYGYR